MTHAARKWRAESMGEAGWPAPARAHLAAGDSLCGRSAVWPIGSTEAPTGQIRFADFTLDGVPALLAGLAKPDRPDAIAVAWVEKLSRYTEIWRLDLTKRLANQFGGRAGRRTAIISIAAILSHAAVVERDFRFLSAALKLLDRRGVNLERALSKRDPLLSAAAYHALLATEAAQALLEKAADG